MTEEEFYGSILHLPYLKVESVVHGPKKIGIHCQITVNVPFVLRKEKQSTNIVCINTKT
ncbi:hypothetical protein FUAX_20670 [Fulvitalea axinellae]|uniref:Uncharacterized protein n=1 Tax=Fulvitalea axinellae TaxID=1182444 RepID=A0AAU9CK33_9BACT|nr:hypothetical protein FUAX_20670 [Fulvitalea axinellae]